MVIPLPEIKQITQREVSAKKMLKSQNASKPKDNDIIYVMEVSFKQSYLKIAQLIQNFHL